MRIIIKKALLRLVLIACIFLTMAFFSATYRSFRLMRYGQVIQGKVLGVTSESFMTINPALFRPSEVVKHNRTTVILEFVDDQGKIHHISFNDSRYMEGDSVQLVYEPQDPENVSFNSVSEIWNDTKLYLILDLVFLAVGGLLIRKWKVTVHNGA